MSIPNPNQIAARIKPKSVRTKTDPPSWKTTDTVTLTVGDVVMVHGVKASYTVESWNNGIIRLVPYGALGVGKVPPRTLDIRTTHHVKVWR